jgi:hypothetical protein
MVAAALVERFEVVRRQPDGTWRYIVDRPVGSSETIP